MKAPTRLGLYGIALVVVFIVAGFTANAVVPEETVLNSVDETRETDHHAEGNGAPDGYELSDLRVPGTAEMTGDLSLIVLGPDGQPVTDVGTGDEQGVHLIAVRSDGQFIRHEQPTLGEDGTWSAPWRWEAPGSYRVFVDFVPAPTREAKTLSASIEVTEK